jgi:uncharacterized heparinase superfamily protein
MWAAILDRPKIIGLVLNESWRRFYYNLRTSALLRWRFSAAIPEKLLIAPQDLRTVDPHNAFEVYSGRFFLAGEMVETYGSSPFEMTSGSENWHRALHSFGWLRHLRAADSDLSRASAQALVRSWIQTRGKNVEGIPWEIDTTAQRVMSWLCHSPVLIKGTDYDFYRLYLKNLASQVRYLKRMCNSAGDGEARLLGRIALVYAGLCISDQQHTLKSANRNLEMELERQILPDGGHVSRSPTVLLELLSKLLPLHHTYTAMDQSPPQALTLAIDRMLPALRFFRHSDGNFAHFNGAGTTPTDLLNIVLRYDQIIGQAPKNASHSGYQRLEGGSSVLIMDTGFYHEPSFSKKGHAGCLSFEFSSKGAQFVVNCGALTSYNSQYLQFARATAAHSTAVIEDTSSARFHVDGALANFIGTPILSNNNQVEVDRSEMTDYSVIKAIHDGYKRQFGAFHERTISFAKKGDWVQGADRFLDHEGKTISTERDEKVAIRFHIHPDVSISTIGGGNRVLLAHSQGEAWIFTALDCTLSIEESIFFSGPSGARKTEQLVLHVPLSGMSQIRWQFERTVKQKPRRRQGTQESNTLFDFGLDDEPSEK